MIGKIIIDPETNDVISQKCIDKADVETAVLGAEREKLYFEDKSGNRICALRLENLTYWVRYSPSGEGFEVKDAYFHRMSFEEAVQ